MSKKVYITERKVNGQVLTYEYQANDENIVELDWMGSCNGFKCRLMPDGRIQNACDRCFHPCFKPYGNWTWSEQIPKDGKLTEREGR